MESWNHGSWVPTKRNSEITEARQQKYDEKDKQKAKIYFRLNCIFGLPIVVIVQFYPFSFQLHELNPSNIQIVAIRSVTISSNF